MLRIGLPIDIAEEARLREDLQDKFGQALNDAAIREVIALLIEAGELNDGDDVKVELRSDSSLDIEDEIRPIWISDVYTEVSGKKTEENVRLYIYHAPEFDNQN